MKTKKFMQHNYRELVELKYGIGPLDPTFNCLDGDGWDPNKTVILHYTKMSTQPWHPYPTIMEYGPHQRSDLETLWHDCYKKALEFEEKNNIILGAPTTLKSPPIMFGDTISKVAGT